MTRQERRDKATRRRENADAKNWGELRRVVLPRGVYFLDGSIFIDNGIVLSGK